jgi:hypothetical protein
MTTAGGSDDKKIVQHAPDDDVFGDSDASLKW